MRASSISTCSPMPETAATCNRLKIIPGTSSCRETSATRGLVGSLLTEHKPRAILHFAAESHVDRSIAEAGRIYADEYLRNVRSFEQAKPTGNRSSRTRKTHSAFCMSPPMRSTERFSRGSGFSETTPYAPNSPYAASKASSDSLARACFTPTNFPCSPPTAPITTAHSSSLKNSSRS